jgi:hypothetical protein
MMSEEKRSIPERSAETWAAVSLLRTIPELGIVTYEQLAASIGCDPQREGRHHVVRAAEILAREDAIEFAPVVNVGMKRADDLLKVSLGRFRLRKAARQARRSRRALAAVEKWDALPDDKKREHNILAAQAGAIQAMASVRTERLLAGKTNGSRLKLDPGESLKLMKDSL